MEPEDTNEKQQENAENASSISSDLIRGHINTIILRMLYDGDKYGYEIINEIEEKSKGQYTLKQPTLYSALKRLESQDYVTSYWGGASSGGRRKYFQITDKGKAVVEHNRAEWEYSRTVIDSLISVRDYDFSNPPPSSSVDFQILKKSTSRVPVSYAEEEDGIELMDTSPDYASEKAKDEAEEVSSSAPAQEQEEPAAEEVAAAPAQEQAAEPVHEEVQPTQAATAESAASATISQPAETAASAQPEQVRETQEERERPAEPIPLTEAEKQRIHENYRALIGNEEDATSHYYAHVTKDRTEENEQSNAYEQYAQDGYSDEYAQDDYYAASPSAADMMYASKSPAERNYKDLLNKLYDSSNSQEEYYEEMEQQAMQPQQAEPPAAEQQVPPPYEQPPQAEQEAPAQTVRPAGNTASNIEFYDVEERAQKDGLRVTTTNGSRNRTSSKNIGNTFNKGKALFLTAVYVFIVMLAECIISHCLRNQLETGTLYILLPYLATFVMLGIFLFLYLNGYGKNSRKSQSRTYISASLIIFADIVLVIVVIAYLVIYFGNTTLPTWIQIVKYAIFPIIFCFNLPLFAILYRVNCNRQ